MKIGGVTINLRDMFGLTFVSLSIVDSKKVFHNDKK